MIKSFAFVVHPVRDLQKSIAFYRDSLGLGKPEILHERWAEFDVGGTTFAIAAGGEAIGIQPGSAFTVGFEVDDFDGTIKQLQANGVKMEEPFESPTCRSCFASDPDGNRFAVHKLKSV